MNIHFLLVKNFFKGGGIETYTRVVGVRLVQRGHDVTVYSTGGDEHSPRVWEGVKIVWLPKIRPYWTEKFCGALMATYLELTTDRPDVIHLHSVAAGAMAAFLRVRSTPCIVQMHGVEWKRSSWGAVARTALRTMEWFSVSFAHAVTAVSKTQCEFYSSHYGADCQYIPTAVDLKDSASPNLIIEIGLRPREYVLFASRLVPEKGAHYLIRAFRHLRTTHTLVIAGGGTVSDSYHRQLIELAAGDDRIKFLGDVRDQLLSELFSNAAVFVQPSELEGLSIGLIEAMSYGLPCVVSDIPENREVIGEAGHLFRSRDADHLCEVLGGALAAGPSSLLSGELARRRVADLFCWDTVVDQLEDLYSRVAAEKKVVPADGWSKGEVGVDSLQKPTRQSTAASGE